VGKRPEISDATVPRVGAFPDSRVEDSVRSLDDPGDKGYLGVMGSAECPMAASTRPVP
jgi:hypothetical protein